MYFNAFLAKTLLAFSGEWGEINSKFKIQEFISASSFPMPNAQYPMPNAQCPMPHAPSLTFDLNRWTFKNIMKVYLSLQVFNS
ncbi:MAG: hypothetical protein V7K86_09425 [Nostoc sp.]|uniref:hypothetical protein n=1 Tax=Nostoc sp. TaxID=1180 RepID=UPI002FF9505B